MRIAQVNRINLRKLKVYKVKAMFLIIPIILLVALSIVVSSQVKNFTDAANTAVFGTIDQQSTLLELTKSSAATSTTGQGGAGRFSFSSTDNNYTESDLAAVKSVSNVTSAAIASPVPVSNAKTSDLFSGKTLALNNLTGINSDLAGLYTTDNFTYTEGQDIPIILNANSFNETYEDWGGQSSVTVTVTRPTAGQAPTDINTPIKTSAISYNKDDLIGKEITITVGGLADIQDYTQSFSSGGLVFTKKTADAIATEASTRQTAISTYWDYTKISTPQTYKFKVVGVIETPGTTSTYIPEDAANAIMNKYIQNQLDARNTTALDIADLNSKYTGITFDGTEIQSTSFNVGGRLNRAIKIEGGARGGFQSQTIDQGTLADSTTYEIPGLVIQTDRSTESTTGGFNPFASSGTVVGEYKDANVYSTSPKSGPTILIKIASASDKAQVVSDLNTKGYAYQDLSQSEVFKQLKSTLSLIATALTITFIAISILVISFTMGKFVSESKKEIGILRALGATKGNIRTMFISQAVLYTFISYVIGSILGFLLLIAVAAPFASWFDSVVGKTIKQSFNVVATVDPATFKNFDVQTFAIYSVLLLVIALLISLIPATRASRVSPVSAIKND